MTEENDNKEQTKDFKDELNNLKEEMAQLKDMLKSKAEEEAEEEVNIGGRSKERGFRIEFDDEDFGFEGIDETLGDYLSSVMEGVAQNISQSMKQMTSGFQFEHLADEMKKVKHDLKRSKHDVEREIRRAEREAKRAAKRAKGSVSNDIGRRTVRFRQLSAEELEQFYKSAPDLTSALSDEKKLRLLKGLEDGPMYQKDLSELTDIKGGTFKHHMDSLTEVQYVAQEAVRGRYFITQLGIEALKLSEMLFRRFIFITEEDAKEREEKVDTEIDRSDTVDKVDDPEDEDQYEEED